MSSIRSSIIRRIIVRNMDRMFDLSCHSIEEIRSKKMKIRLPRTVLVQKFNIGQIEAEWVSAHDTTNCKKAVLYLHSGAFCFGYDRIHTLFASKIAKECGVRVLGINYRLAPEHPYPAPVEDCINAYRFLLQTGYTPEDIIVGGESAGASLVLLTLIMLRDEGFPMPAAAFLLCAFGGMIDFIKDSTLLSYNTPESVLESNRKYELFFYGSEENYFKRFPLYSSMKGFPDLLIQAAEYDIMAGYSIKIHQKAKKEGVNALLSMYDKMWHVFQMFSGIIPEGTKAVREIGDFCRAHW